MKATKDMMKATTSSSKVKKHEFKVPTSFDCPVCKGKGTVIVQLNMTRKIGTVHCRAPECKGRADFTSSFVPRLEQPVDLYFRFRDQQETASPPAPDPSATPVVSKGTTGVQPTSDQPTPPTPDPPA